MPELALFDNETYILPGGGIHITTWKLQNPTAKFNVYSLKCVPRKQSISLSDNLRYILCVLTQYPRL